MVVGLINGLSHAIMGGKNYKRYEDLRGATIGGQSLTSGITFPLKQVLKSKGLESARLQAGQRRRHRRSFRSAIERPDRGGAASDTA